MKKIWQQNEFEFISNPDHIYNKMIDEGLHEINAGWDKFIFELHSNLTDGEEKLDGVTEFDSRVIKLEMSLSNKDAKETIMHEIMHCILAGIGLEERNYEDRKIVVTNEYLASTITRQLQLVNQLNPGLFKLIYDIPTET